MTSALLVAVDPEVEHLVPYLEEFARSAPPHPLELCVTGGGSRLRGNRVFIDRRDIGQPWELATLAHEYAHAVDPAVPRHALLVKWWCPAAPLLLLPTSGLALWAAGIGVEDLAAVLWLPWLAITAACWRTGSAVSHRDEFHADAHAAEVLGPGRRHMLDAMLNNIARRRKDPRTG